MIDVGHQINAVRRTVGRRVFEAGEARVVTALSSQRWCDASIAAGTDPAEAQAAAERTTAAYTGTVPE